MYAIIRAGGKQAKVQSGDVIEIERVKGDSEQLEFAPLLVVDDKGNAVSDRETLAKASVTAKVLGETQGEKIDIFKYKNKSGYRRHQGHRQKYTQIEITGISLPGAAKAKSTSSKTTTAKTAEAKAADSKPAESKPAAAKSAEAKPSTAKGSAAKSGTSSKSATSKTGSKTAASKAAKSKTDSSEEE